MNHTPDHARLDLDEIAARAAGLYEYATGLDAAWQAEADQLAGTDVPALLAEVRRLRAELAELKRPAVEAKRNEIRSSYAETIAQARDDRDYEGAFALECQLREREEQWRDEDRAAAS